MATCLVPDFPAVMVALEHLKELDKQLKEEEVPFAPDACLHLTEITAAVTELEAERRAAREHLEVETIENSKLRHRINNLREQMSQEIKADVEAARASNSEEIQQLQKDLGTTSQLQEATVKRQEVVLSQNEALSREREQVKAEHEATIATLNDEITLKYNLQTQLDQTGEQIEQLKSRVAAAEQDKIALRQKIEQERENYNMKKDNLSEEMHQTEENINKQKHAIKMNRKELVRFNNKKHEIHDHRGELVTTLAKQESNMQRLTVSRRQCEKQLDHESQKRLDYRQQRENLKKQLRELEEAFRLAIQNLKEEIATVEGKIKEGRVSKQPLVELLAQIYEIFKRQHDEENGVRAEHVHVSQQLQRSKLQLEECIASIVKHSKEVREMDKQIRELLEAEVINKRMFDSNQEELCSNVDTEKNNTRHCEGELNRQKRLLEEANVKQEEHVAKMTSDISNTRRRYEELRQEEAALLQRQPRSADVDLLMRHVAEYELMYRQVESKQLQEIEQVTAEIEIITRSSEKKQVEVGEKEKILKEVEAKMIQEQTRHQRLTELTSTLGRRRSELALSIQGLREETCALLQPQDERKAELKALRSNHTQVLDRQASELRAVEMSIYNNSVKLEQVSMENSRLHLCIRQMTEDVGRARQNKDQYWQEVHGFTEDLKALCERLQEAWAEDLLLTQDYQSSNAAVLTSLSDLLKHLKTRRQQLGNVNSLLHQQMLDFSKRLGDKTAVDQHS